MLKVYNDLTRTQEELKPLIPGEIRMYVCGMTVYDLCHLGHARVLVVFDMVARYLRFAGYKVRYIRNITDIDDKIIQRAAENGETIQQLTDRFIEAMLEDAKALGVLPPDEEPRATHHIGEILQMIQRLVDNGYAYHASNGDVYYSVAKFEGYGKLSGKSLSDLRAGERVAVDENKQDPLDFVLWKASKPDEPAWDSPWGPGRPGWHIECSAMSTSCLGNTFDIHGGGADLTFPHHENEIAQAEAATGQPFVTTWMHNGFVRINDEKMSKSLGNFFTVREILARYRPEEVRYFILTSHYRSPLNYDEDHLLNARAALTRFYTSLRGLDLTDVENTPETDESIAFAKAMNDDFNTPEALSVLFELVRKLNRIRNEDAQKANRLGNELRHLGGVLGLLQSDPESYLQGSNDREAASLGDDEINRLIDERLAARNEKNWGRADEIRDQLQEAGILLEDSGTVTNWRRG